MRSHTDTVADEDQIPVPNTRVDSDSNALGSNLLLICVDCLRQDFLQSDRTETPFLDSLRERGLECTEMYATATTTTPAVASLLTGTYSERNGVYSLQRGRLAPDVDSLASVLSDSGWYAEAMTTGPLVPETGLDRGFDQYQCRGEDESAFGDWGDHAVRRLASLPEPFVAFIHLWELHEDIHVPRAYDNQRYGETAYGRALSALDNEIRSFVEAVPENTLVAVVGDHGESITHRHNPIRLVLKSLRDAVKYYGGVDTRGFVERINRLCDGLGPDVNDHFLENGHGENVFDFTTNVPFVLTGPGVDPAIVNAQVRQIDVLPTVLDTIGITVETDGSAIRPADGVEDRIAYLRACGASLRSERNWARAVRDGDTKYVEYPGRSWEPEIFDLASDPRELVPVDDDAIEARLAELLPEQNLDPSEIDRLDVEDRLRDLGYR